MPIGGKLCNNQSINPSIMTSTKKVDDETPKPNRRTANVPSASLQEDLIWTGLALLALSLGLLLDGLANGRRFGWA